MLLYGSLAKYSMIPLILHHTYKTATVPHPFDTYVVKWQILNPSLQQKVWSDADNTSFVETHYPEYFDAYSRLPYKIQQIDVVRYMYLHTHGGVYADIDLEPIRSIAPLINTNETMLALEPSDNKINMPFLISNYWMASPAHSEFLRIAIQTALQPFAYSGDYIMDVLNSTGCLMLNTVYRRFTDKKPILLDSELFSPFTHDQILKSRAACTKLSARNAYAIHHFVGTWH